MFHSRTRVRTVALVGLVLGLVASVSSASPVTAKAKACKKGFVRQKSRCVKKRAATTTKKAATSQTTRTTAKPSSASKGTIKIGTMGTSINASTRAATLDETRKVAQAWQKMVNDQGGINGYRVQVLYKDEFGDSARALQAIKDLDSDGIVALAGQGDAGVMPAIASYLNSKKIPVIGGTPYTPEYDSHPMFFPVSGSFSSNVYGQVATAKDAGAKFYENLYCAEVAACAQSVPVTKDAAAREGLKWRSESASAVASDLTAQCLNAKNAGVDFLQANGVPLATLVRDCTRQNYHPIFNQGGSPGRATLDAAAGEQVAGVASDLPIWYDGPEATKFRKLMATTDLSTDIYGSTGSSSSATLTSMQTYIGLEMAGAIINKLTMAQPTRADFLEATYTIKGETLGGMVPPADYTPQRPGTGMHAARDCWFEYIVKDGKYYLMDKNGQVSKTMTFGCGSGKVFTSSS